MKYTKYPLSEIVSIISGGTPKKSIQEYWEHGTIPWLSIKDFNNDNRYVYNSSDYITELGLKNSSTHLLEKGDVILSARGTVGEVAQLARRMAFNQSCFGLRADDKYTTNEYIYYWLKHNISYLKNNTHGSVFDTINRKTFENLYVELPTKQYQYEVTEILTRLDDKIELNKQIIDTLEGIASTLFKHWFVDFEFPDDNGKPYKSSEGKMDESEIGEIPEGWERIQLGDLVTIIDNRGKTPPLEKEKTQYPIIDVKALSGESILIDYNQCSKFVNVDIYNNWFRSGHPKENDILLSTVGSIGQMKIFKNNIGAIAQNVVALRSNNISPYYLFEYLKFIKQDLVAYNIGSVQPSIKVTHIIKHDILVPNENLISIFDAIVKNIVSCIVEKDKEANILTEIRDALLPKLLSGEIELRGLLDEEQ